MKTRCFVVTCLAVAWACPAPGEGPKAATPPRAPEGYVIFEKDRAGAFFIAAPLNEKYDAIRKQVADLAAEIRDARIDSAKAKARIAAYQEQLDALLKRIDATKLYIPGATIHTRTETSRVPLAADDLLLIDAANVEIRGWDGPDLQCVLEKTVLGDGDKGDKAADDFAGIELVTRRASSKEFFGYYQGLAATREGNPEWDRFPLKGFLDREFAYVTVKGLTHEEGNRQIEIVLGNRPGPVSRSSQWSRHATLTVLVPRCKGVGVRGALGRFRVRDLDAPLSVQGEGDRDYAATYEIVNLGGPLAANDLPVHRLDGVRGSVSVTATAYLENRSHGHGPDGQTLRADAPKASVYRDIRGDLTARFLRADLTLEGVAGRVDVVNDFGNTVWQLDRPPAQGADHRVVTQSGSVGLRLVPKSLGALRLTVLTECGTIRLPEPIDGFKDTMFTTAEGDTVRRSWDTLTLAPQEGGPRDPMESFALMARAADALHGRPRTPGVDVISRAGTVTISRPGGAR